MSRNIPTVKEWIVTLATGTKLRVLAPTRRLAMLNVRFEGGAHAWQDIEKIGVVRKPVGQRELITVEG